MKTILPYMPLTFEKISSKVFKSFLKMTSSKVRKELNDKGFELFDPYISDKFPICLNRNEAFESALSGKNKADFIMCCDGDQVFKATTLTTLLDTLVESEADAVTGVYFTKTFPYRAVAGHYSPWSTAIESNRESLKSEGFISEDGSQTLYFKHLQYFDVIQPIDVFGLGCLLMRTDLLRKIEQPFCKYINPYSTSGDYSFQGHSEDMWFCSQLKQAGVKVLVNPKVQVGHVVERVINCAVGDDE